MQDCLNCRKSHDNERHIYVGDSKTVQFEIIRVFRLWLKIKFYLDLNKIFIVPSFQGNLISISTLDKFDYFVHLKMKTLNYFMIQN